MGIYPLILDKAERRHSDVTVDDGLGETSQNHPISMSVQNPKMDVSENGWYFHLYPCARVDQIFMKLDDLLAKKSLPFGKLT